MHESIQHGRIDEVKVTISEHPGEKYFYNRENISAAATALTFYQLDVYELLLANGINLGPHEDIEEIVESFPNESKRKLRELHKAFSKHPLEKHLAILGSKSKLSHDCLDDNRRKLMKKIEDAFEELNEIELIEPILKIVACSNDLKILFDFNRNSVEFMDPTQNKETAGLCYHGRGDIYIGAKELLEDSVRFKTLGVMSHELCHYAMNLIYGHACKPYCTKNDDKEEIFKGILKKCELVKHEEPFIEIVYDYPEHQQIAELIVRVPHLSALYSSDQVRLEQCKKTFQELFRFFEQNTYADLQRELSKLLAKRKYNNSNALLNSLKKSPILIKHEAFDLDIHVTESLQVVSSNCPHLTINTIYHKHNRHGNVDLKLIFSKLKYFKDKKVIELLSKVSSLLMKPALIIDCDGHDKNEIVKLANILNSLGMDQRAIFVVNEDLAFQSISVQANCVKINHVLENLTIEAQKLFFEQEIDFQGRALLLENFIGVNVLNKFVTIPRTLFTSKNIQIKCDMDFDESDYYIKRNFLSLNAENKWIEYEVEDVLKLVENDKTIVVFDEPGNGKSTEIKMMAMRLRKKYSKHWVIFVDLKKHCTVYEKNGKVSNNFSNNENIVKFFCEKILKIGGFEAEFFSYLFNANQIIFLLDGFDEVSPCYEQFLMNLLKVIRDHSLNQSWISTRPQYASKLEENSDNKALKLKPFTADNRKEFFSHFFSGKMSTEELNLKLKEIETFLTSFNTSWRCLPIANPLIVRMIVEVFEKDPKFKLQEKNVYSIFRNFFEGLVDNCMNKGPVCQSSVKKQYGSSTITEFFQKSALFVALVYGSAEKLSNMFFSNIPDLNTDDIIRTGLMYVGYEGHQHFIHNTFAEFFAAQFFYENLFTDRTVLKKKQFDDVLEIFIENVSFTPLNEVYTRILDAAIGERKTAKIPEVLRRSVSRIFKKRNHFYIVFYWMELGCLNLLKVFLTIFVKNRIPFKSQTYVYFNMNILMAAAHLRSISFFEEFLYFMESQIGSSAALKMFCATESDRLNILNCAIRNENPGVFEFIVNEAESMMGRKVFKNFVLARDVNGNNGLTFAVDNGQDFITYCSILGTKLPPKAFMDFLTNRDTVGLNCLHHACIRVNSEKLKNFCEILRKALKVTSELKEFLTSSTDNNESTVMSAACNSDEGVFITFMNFIEEVFHDNSALERLLLQRDYKGRTAFHRALENNKRAFISVLDYYQLKINEKSLKKFLLTDSEGKHVLFCAIDCATLRQEDITLALWLFMESLFNGEKEILRELLTRQNLEGETIFEYAEQRAYQTLILLKKFMDKN